MLTFRNIKWANEKISEKDAVVALESVGLYELGLNEFIGETGRQLSGGENIASERIISEYILKQKNKIRIIVSHNLEMQKYADIVISFNDGEINVQNIKATNIKA